MSHVATVDVQVKDLKAMSKACERLGLELVEGQKTYKWWGHWERDYSANDAAYMNGIKPEDYGKCDHAIRVKDDPRAYEIGLCKQTDGSYKLVWDFFGGGYGLMAKVSADDDTKKSGVGKLQQMYAVEVAKAMAKKNGFSVVEKQQADGKIKLECRR